MAHILLVEDDRLNTMIFTKLLERRGKMKVTHSEDPKQIISLCCQQKVDLVLMDISLNKSKYEGNYIDGIEITRLLKNHQESMGIPVILMTSHAMTGDRERYLQESGANAYITKPVTDHEEFIDIIKKLASGG